MSDEYENKSGYQAQSSETLTGSAGSTPDIDYVRPAELPEQDLYHGHTFITKWVFCQDAKVIGVQYFLTAVFTGIVGNSILVNEIAIRFSRSRRIYNC